MTTTDPKPDAPPDLAELYAERGIKPMTGWEFAEALRSLFETEEEKQEFLDSFDDFWPNEPDGCPSIGDTSGATSLSA